VPAPRLWSPADPFLYNLTIAMNNGSEMVDSVESYFGMRNISRVLVGSQYKLFLNGQFSFQFGPLDQGFWPDGIYTAPTDEALRWDIEQTKDFGFNMTRKHVKVEPDRWYYWCDKMGLLVWQDMPSGDNGDAEARANFEHELQRMIECRRNHPSIVTWIVFNEGWGQHDTIRLTQLVKQLDPSRLVSCASGWNDFEVGDVRDSHSYPSPSCPPSTTRIMVNGEFGGIGWRIDGHYWTAASWGYVSVASQAAFMSLYTGYAAQVKDLAESEGLSAAVYTQLTDVEMEVNGLITYDRRVIKPDMVQIRGANQFSITPVSYRAVVNSSQLAGQSWNFTTATPGAGWYGLSFDDAGWSTSSGGFGTAFTPGSAVRTTWDSSDIWLRKHFNPGLLNSTQVSNLVFRLHHDEDVQVYMNGVLAYSATGYTTTYMNVNMNQAGKDAIIAGGDNVIAVHCHQTGGGQYIDVGIYERIAG
ncbi:MAG: glycoside hydrolase family 2, partial [Candidatus Lokiarchaeota archaeon]|nr:glycoside hydrolase family 2 [Candidatus Lokiarchaeota archaeon]